jgi:hypothetical protein
LVLGHLLICVCWVIFALTMAYNNLFLCAITFNLPVFCWEFLYLCSWGIMVYSSLFCCVFIRLWRQSNAGSIEWVWMESVLILWNNLRRTDFKDLVKFSSEAI